MTLAVILAVLVCDALLFNRVMQSGPLSMTMGKWLPPFGISFTADVLGASFALAGAVATLCVVLYLRGDTPEAAVRDSVYPLVLLLLAGVTGAFLTGDLFNLYVWFEVMLIASFGLIVLAGHPLQLDAAVKYGILNFLATTLFLMGLGLLYGLLGTLNMADIVGAAARADAAPLTAIGALFALLRHEGGGVSGQCVAACLVSRAAARHLGADGRTAHQGGDLCAAAHAGDAAAGGA